MTVTTTCGLCGAVELTTDIPITQPTTDAEYDHALWIAQSLHAFDKHLDDFDIYGATS